MRRLAPLVPLALVAHLALASCTQELALAARPEPLDEPKLSVGFLLLDGIYGSELVAPHDVFHHVRFHVDGESAPGAMEVFTIGRSRAAVTSFEGLRIVPDYSLAECPRVDVLVVPSAEHNMDSDLEDKELIDWVRTRGRSAKHVLSLCDGAFVLAEAGLLDGYRCTTFPGDIPAFRKRYPQLAVAEGVSFVTDRTRVTSAGGAKSYDAALWLVEALYGQKVAEGVARGIVIDWSKERVPHVAARDAVATKGRPSSWFPGERVSAVLERADGSTVTLDEVARAKPCKGIALFLVAGAEGGDTRMRGGLWCEDSFNDLPLLRHLRLDYESKGIRFVAVCCPPVYHEQEFAYGKGAFLHDAGEAYAKNREHFVKRTQALVERDVLPFAEVYYDTRFRLLANPKRGLPSVGKAPSWQGRFKWYRDTQAYGTPTLWILDPDLRVRGKPFYMNVYESEGRLLRYSARDVGSRLDRLVRSE